MNWLNLLLYINSLCWSAVYITAFLNLDINSNGFRAAVFSLVALANASVLTLGCKPVIAIFFQFSLLLPLLFYFNLKNNQSPSSFTLFMSIGTGIVLAYLIKQTIDYYKQVKSRIWSEIYLEESALMLKESNAKILVETTRSENASRLAALGQLAGGIAHEINNPLAIISLSIEIAQKHLLEDKIDQSILSSKLMVISKATERIVLIIRSLKSISNSKQKIGDITEINLEDVVEDCLVLYREKFKSAGIKIIVVQKTQLFVHANMIQVSQILINLLNNSFDALIDLEIEEKFVKIYFSEDNDFIYTSIENSGPIIDIKIQNQLFQPFFTTKEVGRGTGLGLSLCMSIIEVLNGKIWFEKNKLNTTFTFSLPQITKSRIPV